MAERTPRGKGAVVYERPLGPRKVILDVDTGIDDSLALLYAVGHPGVDLVGVTTCAGNTAVDNVVHNTLGVLELAGAPEIEVARGAAHPIARPLETTPETHGPTGTGYATVSPSTSESSRSAIELIVEEARNAPGEITLVTAGPLSNLAAALLAEPDLPSLLGDVFTMGGTFGKQGNVKPRVEWNIHVDPEAARTAFHQWSMATRPGRPITIMGLDVTEECEIHAADLASVARACGLPVADGDDYDVMATPFGHPLLDYVRDSLRFYFEFHEKYDGFYGAQIHDPFVLGAAVNPTIITAFETVVDVELGGQFTTGETIADWRGHLDKPVNAFVATAGEGAGFVTTLCDTLVSLVKP